MIKNKEGVTCICLSAVWNQSQFDFNLSKHYFPQELLEECQNETSSPWGLRLHPKSCIKLFLHFQCSHLLP